MFQRDNAMNLYFCVHIIYFVHTVDFWGHVFDIKCHLIRSKDVPASFSGETFDG